MTNCSRCKCPLQVLIGDEPRDLCVRCVERDQRRRELTRLRVRRFRLRRRNAPVAA